MAVTWTEDQRRVIDTRKKNILVSAAAGSGKTEGAKAIAAGLNLPYMFLTCSADDEKFDCATRSVLKRYGTNIAI